MKQKPLKLCKKCSKPRLRSGTLCYSHYLEHKRELKEASNARKMARKAVRKVKTVQRSALSTKNLDKLWREAVYLTYGRRCAKTGSAFNLNVHHVVGRSNYGTRWYVPNGVILSAGSHMFDRFFSAHQTPTLFAEWIIGVRGKEWHQDLYIKSRNLKPNRQEVHDYLKNIIKKYNG